LTRADLEVEHLELLEVSGSAPASSCDDDHCHDGQGGVDSEEIEGAGGGATPIVDLTGLGTVDLLNGFEQVLGCDPGCGLPLADISLARLHVAHVAVEGLVRDGRSPPRFGGEITWLARIVEETAVEGELELPVDREHEPDVDLRLRLSPTVALLDGIDFASLERRDGIIDLGLAANQAAAAELEASLGELRLEATVSR
jgi:hypothetical protein